MVWRHVAGLRAKIGRAGAQTVQDTHQHGVRPAGKGDAAIGLRGDVEVARRRPCRSSGHRHVGHAGQPFCAVAISIGAPGFRFDFRLCNLHWGITCQMKSDGDSPTFAMLTEPTPLQKRALDLLTL